MEILKKEFLNIKIIQSNNDSHYRNMSVFNLNDEKIDDYTEGICNINSINIVEIIKQYINSGSVTIKNNENNEILINITSDSSNDIYEDVFRELCNKYKLISLYINNELYKDSINEYIVIDVMGYKFSIYSDNFFQVNTYMVQPLYTYINTIISEIEDKDNRICCIGGDSGNISMMLDNLFTIIDILVPRKEIIKSIETNISLNSNDRDKYNIFSENDEFINNSNIVLINPGRKGLSKYIDLIDKSTYIVYMSCSPKILIKDIKLLSKYTLIKNQGFNMFSDKITSKTYVETVNLFKLK